jgi:hypothetical protein
MTRPKRDPMTRLKDPFLLALWNAPDDAPMNEACASLWLDLGSTTLKEWRDQNQVPPRWSNIQSDPNKRPIIRYTAGELREVMKAGEQRERAVPKTPQPADPKDDFNRIGPARGRNEGFLAAMSSPIYRGGRRQKIKHDSFAGFVSAGTPTDEWLFAMVRTDFQGGEHRRPVDLIGILDLSFELIADATCRPLTLAEYASHLDLYISSFESQKTAEQRHESAGPLPEREPSLPPLQDRSRP